MKRVLHTAYLGQLAARYDLEDELSTVAPKGNMSHYEHVYDGCKLHFHGYLYWSV
jgi:hypothetical protein